MAKKAKKAKAKTRKSKKAAPKPRPTRASKTKVAARAAAGVALLAMDEVLKRLPWARNVNDPIELLKADHRRFENLLKEGEGTTERAKKGRREILTTLTSELNVHEALEEKILYPALKPHSEAHDIVLEGFQEHHVADLIVKELHALDKDDEKWGAKFKVLKESVEHHIGEEENKMFPIARSVLKSDELVALGAQMRKLKAELES